MKVYALIAVLSVVIAWSMVWFFGRWDWPEWLVSVPSLGGVYGALYGLFNRVLWRHPYTRRLGLVDISDVSGEYEGELTSTWKDEQGQHVTRKVTFVISQTWTQIEICMDVSGGTSSSRSQSAVASVGKRGRGAHLVYVYHNQVNPTVADADMSDHEGAADIEISPGGTIAGRYFNSRPRAGTITAKRIS